MADEKEPGTPNPDTAKAEEKGASGGDDIEGLKRHNKALLTELTNKKAEANDVKEKLNVLTAEKEAREVEELKKKGEYKELLEKSEKQNVAFKSQLVKAELKAFAIKEGIIDMDAVALIPTDKIKISDQLEVSGVEEAVQGYKTSKPHFFKDASAAAQDPAAATAAKTVAKPTGASVTDPAAAGATTNLRETLKPGSPEHKLAQAQFQAKYQ